MSKSFDRNIALTLQAEDADAIVTSSTPLAGNIPIDGALLVGAQAVIPNPAYLLLSCAADETGNTFTVVGVDVNGETVTTAIVGVNATTAVVETAYQTVTSFSCSQNCTGAIQLGITTQAYSEWVRIDNARDFLSGSGAALFSTGAVATATLEYGWFQTPANPKSTLLGIIADTLLAGSSANTATPFNNPADAVRLRLPTWTSGTVTFAVRQANSGHSGPY